MNELANHAKVNNKSLFNVKSPSFEYEYIWAVEMNIHIYIIQRKTLLKTTGKQPGFKPMMKRKLFT